MAQKVIVIGGGAAGIMAAISAAKEGAQVSLWERNDRLGRKLAITGRGRCNVTNTAPIEELIKLIPGNGPFMYSAFNQFSNTDAMDFFESLGVPLKIERGKRVFPASDKAADVVQSLEAELSRLGVKIIYNCRAESLQITGNKVTGVKAKTQEKTEAADAVIIATGGATYPATGSTGDGWEMGEAVGHTIITPKPSLVPLVASDMFIQELAGLALKNVQVTLLAGSKKLNEKFGELLFTHWGLSGPVILSLSKEACAWWQKKPKEPLTVEINLKPALTEDELDARIQRDFQKFARKQYQNSLSELLPKSLIPVIIELSGVPADKPVHQITKEERHRLLSLLQHFAVSVVSPRPLSEAIVTAGGINVKEIWPKTMESRLISGLYWAGEVMDVDGYTGGHNLQVAFSSGWVAGKAAAKAKNEE